MRVLVTGASGYLGRTITSHLLQNGLDVIGVSRTPLTGLTQHSALDIATPSFIALITNSVAPCDVIVHAAANLDRSLYAPEVVLTNCLGTQHILELARIWQVSHLTFLSSVPVIGIPRCWPITEDHPVNPPGAYYASKVFGEHLIALARQSGLNSATLRLTAPIGPGIPETRILAVFIKQAMSGKPIRLLGQGTRRQNYVDKRDVAQAIQLCIEQCVNGLFNIAGASSLSNLELAKACLEIVGSHSAIELSEQPDPEENYNWDVSTAKAHHTFGYTPRFSIQDMITTVWQALREKQ